MEKDKILDGIEHDLEELPGRLKRLREDIDLNRLPLEQRIRHPALEDMELQDLWKAVRSNGQTVRPHLLSSSSSLVLFDLRCMNRDITTKASTATIPMMIKAEPSSSPSEGVPVTVGHSLISELL